MLTQNSIALEAQVEAPGEPRRELEHRRVDDEQEQAEGHDDEGDRQHGQHRLHHRGDRRHRRDVGGPAGRGRSHGVGGSIGLSILESPLEINGATIRNRLQVYERQTAPLVDYYKAKGLLRTVPATGEVDAVYSRLKSALDLK